MKELFNRVFNFLINDKLIGETLLSERLSPGTVCPKTPSNGC